MRPTRAGGSSWFWDPEAQEVAFRRRLCPRGYDRIAKQGADGDSGGQSEKAGILAHGKNLTWHNTARLS